jgi:ArsR family transcriptional regulator
MRLARRVILRVFEVENLWPLRQFYKRSVPDSVAAAAFGRRLGAMFCRQAAGRLFEGGRTPTNHSFFGMISMSTQLLEKPRKRMSSAPAPQISDQLERDLVKVFKLLADETRLKILLLLMQEGELHVSALCERLGQSQPAVSHHLALLRVARMINSRRDGKHNFYSVQRDRFHEIVGELFTSMKDEGRPEVRFDEWVLKQNE